MNASRSCMNALLIALLWAVAMTVPGAGEAAEVRYRKTTGAYAVYLGIMPGELISGPAPEAGASPFQPPSTKDTHHVMVSIFDLHGRRITDASIGARVAPLGFSGVRKTLEASTALGAPVHAGFFPMPGRGPFRVDIEFSRPNVESARRVRFYFRHPSFAQPKAQTQQEGKQ